MLGPEHLAYCSLKFSDGYDYMKFGAGKAMEDY